MSPPQEYRCPNCHAAKRLRGSRAFASVACAACGAEWRPRGEVGGYRLDEQLACGGFSLVFRASDPAGGASVAVKIFALPPGATPEDAVRFTEEVQTLAAHEHPHWLRIFGGGWEEDFAWLAMEWLPEGSLAGRGRLGENEALHFAAQIADALVAAHACGLRHRNLCIGECLITDAHTVKVSGFAEAALYQRAGVELGTVWGRLSCAPPERLFEAREDSRSEIYALGAILFQLLSGELPYEGEMLPELFAERLEGPPPRVVDYVPAIRESVSALVDRMLALEPGERFSSWEETAEFLGRELGGWSPAIVRPVKKPRGRAPVRGARVVIVMVAGIAGAAGWFGWKHFQRQRDAPDAPLEHVPVTVAVLAKSEVPAKRASLELDWGPWKKFVLESPARVGMGRGGEIKIAGGGALRLEGNNSGMSGGHDENVFYARQMGGDWTFTARVSANNGPAGIVAREGIGSDRPCVGIFIGPDGTPHSVIRQQPAAKITPVPRAVGAGSKWLRIARRGAAMSAFHSPDGERWREAATLNLSSLPASVPVGFVVWSGAKEKLASATFADVTLKVEP